ncbi:glycosyltransferase [Pararhodospirillum oryzae]|uniref:Uncharacterized protein n=1 Tax=Pararhodospirillum oryzae TaxID=478448 RepID=A0A512H7V5_9PROT|nr:glycosyltransferase [Pararhodospirillum oryzae]GEO81536.1 hypothetical protein ROR02_16670 [Pararhodospirillum oryzae]
MNLLFIHQSFPAQYKHVAPHFAALGHRVVVLRQELGRSLPGVQEIIYAPEPVPDPGKGSFLGHVGPAFANARAVLEQARRLKAQGFTPDVMIGHNAWGETLFLKDVWPDTPLLSYFEYFYGRPGGDAAFDPEFPPGPDNAPHGRIMNTINLLGLQAADWGQSPTYWQRSRYPEIHHPRISVLHEGIDTDVLVPRPGIQLFLPGQARPLTRQDEVITFVSRNLEPYRGFHVFMRALPEILRRRPRAQVLIIGGDGVSYGPPLSDGRSFKDALLEEQKGRIDLSRVHFLGQVPYEHFVAVLQVSSVHLYLTYPFVLSWSMLEAMSTGCLVVGSRTPPVQEVIEDGVNGLLVDFFDRQGIADQMDRVLDHPDRLQDIRDAARRTILEGYDLRRVCLPRHVALIETLATGRPPLVPEQRLATAPPRPDDRLLERGAPASLSPVPAPPPPVAAALPPVPSRMSVEQALQTAARAQAQGSLEVAERILSAIVTQSPGTAVAAYRLALLHHGRGEFAEAARLIEQALLSDPENATYHCDLGVMYKNQKNLEKRLECYRRAVELDPKNPAILANYASALNDDDCPMEAEVVCRQALAVNDQAFAAVVNLGSALMAQNRLDEALEQFEKANVLDPNYPENGKNLGMCLLLKGDLPRGFAAYEGRFASKLDVLGRSYPQPRWDGRPFPGRTLFLHSEQGMGDTLQFIRYVPLVKILGSRVIVECQEPLLPVVRTVKGADEVIAAGTTPPPFDLYCSLMSLPYLLGDTLSTLPADVPYVSVPGPAPRLFQEARATSAPFKVGLVWAGSPGHGNDRRRSMALSALAPLLDVPGVTFFSLQKGPAADQLSAFKGRLIDLGPALSDFGDTAAVVSQLDLVIAVDTSIIHLAGALGRPVWALLAFHPDWRWLLEREDTPWYPSMRLFRQGPDGRWGPVVERVRAALQDTAVAARTDLLLGA